MEKFKSSYRLIETKELLRIINKVSKYDPEKAQSYRDMFKSPYASPEIIALTLINLGGHELLASGLEIRGHLQLV